MKNKKLISFVSAMAVTATMIVPIAVSHAESTVLNVGADEQYKTINAAIDAITTVPKNEEERVYINVDPGDYEEQIIIDNLKYVTLQQTPETSGRVNLSWYYCTGYCASNADLNGEYNSDIDWSLDSTWNGSEGNFTKYEIGQRLDGVSTISYYDKNGTVHKNVAVKTTHLGNTGGLDKMATLIVRKSSTDITVKDFNIVNSVPVMVTQGEKDAHLTPEADRKTGVATSFDLPERTALSVCDENTVEEVPTDVLNSKGEIDKAKYKQLADSGRVFTAGESAFLAKSSGFNERGHGIAFHGDRIILEMFE